MPRCRAGKYAGADSFRDYSQRFFRRARQPDAISGRHRRDAAEYCLLAAGQLRHRQLAQSGAHGATDSRQRHDPDRATLADHLLALEEKDARGLGVSVTALRRGVLLCCAVLVAAQVAVSGSIAWVGLVIPHLARLLVGADHRRLLPTAFWLGGGFMIVVDDLARSLTQAEIPVGIITALLGAPLFTRLLIHSRRRGWSDEHVASPGGTALRPPSAALPAAQPAVPAR